jgi:hypothetical protein
MVSINYWNSITIIRAIFEKIVLFWGGSPEEPVFVGASMFIFIGNGPMISKLLNTEFE